MLPTEKIGSDSHLQHGSLHVVPAIVVWASNRQIEDNSAVSSGKIKCPQKKNVGVDE